VDEREGAESLEGMIQENVARLTQCWIGKRDIIPDQQTRCVTKCLGSFAAEHKRVKYFHSSTPSVIFILV
jgi:hypothetical protein